MRARAALGLVVFVILACAGPSACGDGADDASGVPSGAVARVGDALITKQQVHDFMPSDASSAEVRREGPERLILLEWLRREGKREGLNPAPAIEARAGRRLDMSPFRSQALFVYLREELRKKASGPPPSEKAIIQHYRAHPERFIRPQVRYMRLVATDSRAQAIAAKRALERGQRWEAVIKRYTARKRTPTVGSGDMGAGPGELPDGLDEAAYEARKGAVEGPVETDEAWYVFQVNVIRLLPFQTFRRARPGVSSELQTRRWERGGPLLARRLLARYRPLTICAANVRLPHCRNRPIGEGDAETLLEP